ncbi:PfkB family carbohydrate kinase [Streptomyces sp. NPDC051104]|uniref:PfkB family carbohydrate kinase n=1 Tax=Streptomyces sp. NPDC051104 TaxID=3155044 RepID=UPI0034415205
MNVLGFGDNTVDRFVDRGIDYPGGNCVNVAVFARRLGLDAAYLGVFGDDDLGTFVRTAVAAQGVAVEHSVVRHGETSVSTLCVRDGDGSSSATTGAASALANRSRWTPA